MRLVAIAQQLTGEYGTVTAGQEFEVRDDIAAHLLRDGSARRATTPRVLYDTKVVVPEAPEVGARPSFRTFGDVPVPDAKPPAMADASDPLFPVADVCKPGTADHSRRRGRAGSDTGE